MLVASFATHLRVPEHPRNIEEIRTPDGELYYDTIQRVRHVLLSEGVRLARLRA